MHNAAGRLCTTLSAERNTVVAAADLRVCKKFMASFTSGVSPRARRNGQRGETEDAWGGRRRAKAWISGTGHTSRLTELWDSAVITSRERSKKRKVIRGKSYSYRTSKRK